MKKTLILACMILGICACAPKQHDLVILHLNDTHSHLDPQRDGSGGVIERAAYIDSVRMAEGKNNVLLLHAGDFNQGSSYYTVLKGELEVDMVNALGYDCITLGNHEFDNGLEDLGARLARIKCPVVCCNYDFSTFEVGKKVTPYTIIKKAGRRIGIIGVLCNISTVVAKETADRVPALDTATEVNRWADYLKQEEGCDLVIVLSHAGFKGEPGGLNDVDIVPLTTNVDLLVGGHSHTHLTEMYYGQNAEGRAVPVVQDWCWGHQVGKITVR